MVTAEELIIEYNNLETRRRSIVRSQSMLTKAIDGVRLTERPTYPTLEQVDGIDAAIRHIREGGEDKSHHGTPMNADGSVLAHARGWISVQHKAPYQFKGARKLWQLTQDEEDTIINIFQNVYGIHVTRFWQHSEGLSIEVEKE